MSNAYPVSGRKDDFREWLLNGQPVVDALAVIQIDDTATHREIYYVTRWKRSEYNSLTENVHLHIYGHEAQEVVTELFTQAFGVLV